MKSIYILLISILSIGGILAQDDSFKDESIYRIGFNFGPNYNKFRGNEYFKELHSRLNFTAGISFEYRVTENLSLLTNINYELKTIKSEYGRQKTFNLNPKIYNNTNPPWTAFQNGNVDIEELSRFHYLNIPVLVRYYFGYKKEFFVNTGFFYNRLLYANTTREFSEDFNSNVFFIDPEEFFIDHDIGLSFGLGTSFKISQAERIFLEFRYDLGLSNVVKNLSETYSGSLKFIANWSFDL